MRKTLTYTVADKNRDQGKVFLITELSATDAETWAMEAMFALMNAGVEVPDDIAEMGLAGFASIGLSALGKVPFGTAKPLFDKMMECIQCIPDPSNPNITRKLVDSDTEEISTRIKLRKEVFSLHTDFLRAANE